MRLTALLSWWDEDPAWLRELILSLKKAQVDTLIAVDGRYGLLPAKDDLSAPAQSHAILAACREAGIACTIHVPTEAWVENEVGKRRFLFELAHAHASDWFFVIDGDELVLDAPEDLKDRLENAEQDACYASLLHEPAVAVYAQWVDDIPLITHGHKVWPLRCLFRAIPGLTVGRSHSDYMTPDGRNLWGQNRAPALAIGDLVIDHRRDKRPQERIAGAEGYYAIRDRLRIEKSPRRVLVVGYGHMGRLHERVLRRFDDVEIETVDPAGGDYASLAEAPDAHMACIAVPPEQLAEVALEALAKDLHILIEKPMALSLGDARRVVEEAEKRDLTVHVGYVERFNPVVRALRHHLPDIGTIRGAYASRLGPYPGRPTAGPVLDLATHDIDVLLPIFGHLTLTEATVTERMCELEFGHVTVAASYDHPEKVRALEVVGDKGTLSLDYQAQTLHLNGENLPVVRAEPLEEQWHYALRTRGVDASRSLQTLDIALQAAESLALAA